MTLTIKKTAMIILTTIVIGISLSVASIELSKALDQVDAENTCIAKHISQGVERSEIETFHGTCYIK